MGCSVAAGAISICWSNPIPIPNPRPARPDSPTTCSRLWSSNGSGSRWPPDNEPVACWRIALRSGGTAKPASVRWMRPILATVEAGLAGMRAWDADEDPTGETRLVEASRRERVRRRRIRNILKVVAAALVVGICVAGAFAGRQWQVAITADTKRAMAQADELLEADPQAVHNILKIVRTDPEAMKKLRLLKSQPHLPMKKLVRKCLWLSSRQPLPGRLPARPCASRKTRIRTNCY